MAVAMSTVMTRCTGARAAELGSWHSSNAQKVANERPETDSVAKGPMHNMLHMQHANPAHDLEFTVAGSCEYSMFQACLPKAPEHSIMLMWQDRPAVFSLRQARLSRKLAVYKRAWPWLSCRG